MKIGLPAETTIKLAVNSDYPQPAPLSPGRSLVPVKTGPPAVSGPLVDHSNAIEATAGGKPSVPAMDVRNMSPRKMAQLSMDLYVAGIIEWEEHEMMAFQAELHPDFNKSIGALTGQPAQPDRARDYLEEWGRRLDFQRRYNGDDVRRIRRTEHINNILHQIDAPIRLVV